ncbi:MAG: hypothetical protein AAGF95_10335 [Chloroflexota bacterium]
MLKRLFVTSPSIWRRFALVAIIFGLLGNVFLMPLPVSAAKEGHCDDGGPRSKGKGGGYEPGSECAYYVKIGCKWLSDSPGGPKDDVRCAFDIPEEWECATPNGIITVPRDDVNALLWRLQKEERYTDKEIEQFRTSPCLLYKPEGPGDPGNKENRRLPNSRPLTNDVLVPVRIFGVDIPFTKRRVVHTQLRLNLSEPTVGHIQMRGEFEAVQPRDNWVVVDDSDQITCSEYVEDDTNRSRCTVSVTISKPGNWQFDLNLLESENGTPEVSVGRTQSDTTLTFQWLYRAQLSDRNGRRGYSVYAAGEGDQPILFIPGEK